jgi:serine/threonine-protein kinase HipA
LFDKEGRRKVENRVYLTGVQLKLSAIGNPHRQFSIAASSARGRWIVKLPSAAYPRLPENEFR